MKNYIIRLILIIISYFAIILSSIAQEINFDNNILTKISEYLNNIKSMKAKFVQLDNNNSISEGLLYIKKPGKFRWEYKDQPIIIVSNGKSLIYKDTELEKISYMPIEKTMAFFLVRKNIDFLSKDFQITDLVVNEYSTHLSFLQEKQRDIKEFTLVFQNNPFQLGKISFINDQEQKIIINFFNMKVNNKLSDKLFIIKDSRLLP
jgi:outer membrane lipoprotein-sorting protein